MIGRQAHPRLPGAGPKTPGGQQNYLIVLRDLPEPATERDRRSVVREMEERTARFRRSLAEWLDKNKLQGGVSTLGEPMALPMLAITCTPAVAERIGELPEVEGVIADADDIRLVKD